MLEKYMISVMFFDYYWDIIYASPWSLSAASTYLYMDGIINAYNFVLSTKFFPLFHMGNDKIFHGWLIEGNSDNFQ
jgi:hypothetical protein